MLPVQQAPVGVVAEQGDREAVQHLGQICMLFRRPARAHLLQPVAARRRQPVRGATAKVGEFDQPVAARDQAGLGQFVHVGAPAFHRHTRLPGKLLPRHRALPCQPGQHPAAPGGQIEPGYLGQPLVTATAQVGVGKLAQYTLDLADRGPLRRCAPEPFAVVAGLCRRPQRHLGQEPGQHERGERDGHRREEDRVDRQRVRVTTRTRSAAGSALAAVPPTGLACSLATSNPGGT